MTLKPALSICFAVVFAVSAQQRGGGADPKTPKNPVRPTAESIAAGKQVYTKYCAFCHGADAKGDGPMAPKDTHPPSLTDAPGAHGSTDGDIFVTVRDGIGPKFDMKPNKEKISEQDTWNLVNYLRGIGTGKR